MAEERKVYRVLVGKPEGKSYLEDQDVDGRMRSKWMLGRLARGVQSGSSWLRIWSGGGLL
jgi:hypothetical protein